MHYKINKYINIISNDKKYVFGDIVYSNYKLSTLLVKRRKRKMYF